MNGRRGGPFSASPAGVVGLAESLHESNPLVAGAHLQGQGDMMTLEQVTSCVQAAGCLATAAAAYFALRAVRAAERQVAVMGTQHEQELLSRRMEIYTYFQRRFHDIQKQLPEGVNAPGWVPAANEDRLLTLYWYLVFDEWVTCTKGGVNLSFLWTEYYVNGVRSALKIPAFRAKLNEMVARKTSFLGKSGEFYDAVSACSRDACAAT